MSITDPVSAVSVISTGSVEIRPEQAYGRHDPGATRRLLEASA
jgi:FKBP-type peptidyl-prolyl cis-trans isomerase 2